MKKKLILIGGGGHCRSVIDVVEMLSSYEIVGILDRKEKVGDRVFGYDVIGTDDEIKNFPKQAFEFLITLGQIKSSTTRKGIFEEIKRSNGVLATIVSPLAWVSPHASIGEGSVVLHGAIVNAGASVGVNCILNTKSTIEHDTIIGDHNHISTHSVINGGCEIGDHNFIGSGVVVNHGVRIGSEIIVSSGSLVRKHLIRSGVYFGNPLRYVERV